MTHFRIAKDSVKGKTAKGAEKADRVTTRVVGLAADARREEIARMLAGATVTGLAIATATLHETPGPDLIIGALAIVLGIAASAVPARTSPQGGRRRSGQDVADTRLGKRRD